MGKPIAKTHFDSADYQEFRHQLTLETELLKEYCKSGLLSEHTQESGFELELWLLDQDFKPTLNNIDFINQVNQKYLVTEISRSSIEMNLPYDALHAHALSNHQKKLQTMMDTCLQQAKLNKQHLITIGTLPTAILDDYSRNMLTEQQRYQVMDEYFKMLRNYQPHHLQISGREILDIDINSSTLVGAMSSFQMHFRVGLEKSARLLNASMALSAPLVAVCANSPFILGKYIWEESRIVFYEQVLKTAKKMDRLPRVSFGTGYIKGSVLDLFKENLDHYSPMIPQVLEKPTDIFYHLRLHNGTIYRWNRPILGIDNHQQLHFRIEFRPVSAGPSIVDMMANAAFYYGITNFYTNRSQAIENELSFEKAKLNFYKAAKNGLSANIYWGSEDQQVNIAWLIIHVLLPQAKEGLRQLDIAHSDIDYYLSIIEERVRKNQTGSQWQSTFMAKNNADFKTLVQAYLEQQNSGQPVHNWLTT